ncbi:hypothetical protein DFH09DRAFT_1439214 [Mycena vulgaris]|nr:hypothetical protein DFH09DRAFT_1439214 [Mycena vulgaris]
MWFIAGTMSWALVMGLVEHLVAIPGCHAAHAASSCKLSHCNRYQIDRAVFHAAVRIPAAIIKPLCAPLYTRSVTNVAILLDMPFAPSPGNASISWVWTHGTGNKNLTCPVDMDDLGGLSAHSIRLGHGEEYGEYAGYPQPTPVVSGSHLFRFISWMERRVLVLSESGAKDARYSSATIFNLNIILALPVSSD